LVATDSFQSPTRVNVCDGMWSACAADGAISAYRRAAALALSASAGRSYVWMM
jgi:hypothetical protein